jgi:cytidine deaminase
MKNKMDPPQPEQVAVLMKAARSAAVNAYAPYSGFRVGAALLLSDGTIISGANVENASFGLTLCAERSALGRAVSERGPAIRIRAVAVANLNSAFSSPCGACRQMLAEFVEEDAVVLYPSSETVIENRPFAELLPFPFAIRKTESRKTE